MKRRNLVRILIALPLVVTAGIVWLTYREMQREKQNAALIAAIRRDDAPAVFTALGAGADPNAEAIDDQNASFRQILSDFWNRLRGRIPNAKEENTEHLTALILAVAAPKYGSGNFGTRLANPVIVKVLLAKGANPNAVRRVYSIEIDSLIELPGTALCMAAADNDIDSVRLLLMNGASVNLKDKQGQTALIWAALCGSSPIARQLIDRGTDINICNNGGDTALMWAAWNLDVETVTALLKAGAEVRAKNRSGETALDMCQMRSGKDEEVLSAVLKNAGAKNGTKQTAGTK